MILIGSRALALRAPTLLGRKPKDFDFVVDSEADAFEWLNKRKITTAPYWEGANKLIVPGETPIEFETAIPGTSTDMLYGLVGDLETSFGRIPDLDLLFTIKRSHRFKRNSVHFWKTFQDYHRMKLAGAKTRPEYESFLKLREKESYAEQSHPNLNVKKADFFSGDGVSYIYQHDDIHEAVKTLERPAYSYYMKDGSEVLSDKRKFFSLPIETQYMGVIEEAATLAIERSLVPFPNALDPQRAILYAYSKVSSSITSGWFREFSYENGPRIIPLLLKFPYWEKFQTALASKKVRFV